MIERRKRDLSCDSMKSSSSDWGVDETSRNRDLSTGSRGSTRARSDSEDDTNHPNKAARHSRSLLKPPKILITKQ